MKKWIMAILKRIKIERVHFKDSPVYAGRQPSEEFEEAFDSPGGGSRRSCECGREYFNGDGGWDWEEGELKQLRELAQRDPEGYIELDYSCGGMEVAGEFIVFYCPCGRARAYEELFRRSARGIADYLSRRARRIEAEASRVKTEETVNEGGGKG